MKYYHREHLSGYRRMVEEGKRTWGGISYHSGSDDWDDFSSRGFLEAVLPRLNIADDEPQVFEIGTGTGPVACYLARHGYRVEAIDLIPTAIEVADQHAREQGLEISYSVMDACSIPQDGKRFDLIVDSYCLQGIVLDNDRQKVFTAVHARLKPDGYYLVSTSVGRPGATFHNTGSKDTSGREYLKDQKGDLWDPESGVYYKSFRWYENLKDNPESYEDAIEVQGEWFLPNRRVHTPESLAEELRNNGFEILHRMGEEGEELVCIRTGGTPGLKPSHAE